MRQQSMRELGDGEHEHQVEEQFDEGDAVMRVTVPGPQVIGAGRDHRTVFRTRSGRTWSASRSS
jgi:hypothetical protein